MKIGGFWSGPSLKKIADFGTKDNKRLFLKRGVFCSGPGQNINKETSIFERGRGFFVPAQAENLGS